MARQKGKTQSFISDLLSPRRWGKRAVSEPDGPACVRMTPAEFIRKLGKDMGEEDVGRTAAQAMACVSEGNSPMPLGLEVLFTDISLVNAERFVDYVAFGQSQPGMQEAAASMLGYAVNALESIVEAGSPKAPDALRLLARIAGKRLHDEISCDAAKVLGEAAHSGKGAIRLLAEVLRLSSDLDDDRPGIRLAALAKLSEIADDKSAGEAKTAAFRIIDNAQYSRHDDVAERAGKEFFRLVSDCIGGPW